MALSVVQRANNGTSSTVSANGASFGVPTTAGNLLVAVLDSRSDHSPSVTDDAGNVYVSTGASIQDTGSFNFLTIWYCPNALSANTITGHYSTAQHDGWISIFEVSGADLAAPLGAVVTNRASSGTAISSGTVALGGAANALIIAGGITGGPPLTAGGAGYTLDNFGVVGNATKFNFTEFHAVTSAESANATSTSSSLWAIIAASFVAAWPPAVRLTKMDGYAVLGTPRQAVTLTKFGGYSVIGTPQSDITLTKLQGYNVFGTPRRAATITKLVGYLIFDESLPLPTTREMEVTVSFVP